MTDRNPRDLSPTMTTSSSKNSSEPGCWKRRKNKKQSFEPTETLSNPVPKPFDHGISAIPSQDSLDRWWLNTYGRKFMEYRCYEVDGRTLTIHDAVNILRNDPVKPGLLALYCQHEKPDVDQEEEEVVRDSSDEENVTLDQSLVLVRADGLTCKIRSKADALATPVQDLLADKSVTCVIFDVNRLKNRFSSTVGQMLDIDAKNYHDIYPIINAIRNLRSTFFGTTVLQRDIDWLVKLLRERGTGHHQFSALKPEERAIFCFDVHEIFEARWDWVRSLVYAYNARYFEDTCLWVRMNDRRAAEAKMRCRGKSMPKKGLLGDRPAESKIRSHPSTSVDGASTSNPFYSFGSMPTRRCVVNPLPNNMPWYTGNYGHMQTGPRVILSTWACEEPVALRDWPEFSRRDGR